VSSPWLWYISRASGVVALVLLTLVVLLGMLTAARRRPHDTAPTIAMGLHRALGLGVTLFLAAHILTALVDTYVPLGWLSSVVPFLAGYHRPWLGLGTLAFDVFLAVIATSLLRHRLSTRAWRLVHWFSYVMAPAAVVHGLMMATADQPVLLGVTIACGLALTLGAAWRWVGHDLAAHRRVHVVSGEWS
jgi:predicted ferric reductase